jgi:GNAT superfamily N-acetyltransferase
MRQATAGDVAFLVELWSPMLRRADRQDQVHDLEVIVKEAAESAERRLLIAEYDGEPAGAVFLRVMTMTPLNLEPTIQALAPSVTPSFRGKGIGTALMEAAVLWAEDLDGGPVVLAQRQPFHGPALARPRGGSPGVRHPAGASQARGLPAGQCPGARPARHPPPPRPAAGRPASAQPPYQRGDRSVLTVSARL